MDFGPRNHNCDVVSVTVNRDPVVTATPGTLPPLEEGQTGQITVTTNDADGDNVSVLVSTTPPGIVNVDGPNTQGVFDVTAIAEGAAVISFTGSDGNGGVSQVSAVNVTVGAPTPGNSNPVVLSLIHI